MLYVGQLHVVESNKFINFRRTGLKVAPLTRDCANHEFLVLRYNDNEFRGSRRQNVVRYGLLSQTVNPRRYDRGAAISAVFQRRRPSQTMHLKRINCSEFVLECFAIGGAYLVDDYVRVTSTPNQFYFPAHLAENKKFERLTMRYYKLEG